MNKRVLNAGCGSQDIEPFFSRNGWKEVRFDLEDNSKSDISGDLKSIGLADNSVEAVYCSHTLEHLYDHEVYEALSEFYRILKLGGLVRIYVPDIEEIAKAIAQHGFNTVLYFSPAGPVFPADVIYGMRSAIEKGDYSMAHKSGFSVNNLRHRLVGVGFSERKVESIPIQYQLLGQGVKRV